MHNIKLIKNQLYSVDMSKIKTTKEIRQDDKKIGTWTKQELAKKGNKEK